MLVIVRDIGALVSIRTSWRRKRYLTDATLAVAIFIVLCHQCHIRFAVMAATSTLVVSVVNFDTDWDDFFCTYWDSWKAPLQAVGQLTFANIGKGGPDEARSFAATKQKYLAAARSNPDQHWLKVEDPGRKSQGLSCIVGGGAWTHYRENPFRRRLQSRHTNEEELPANGFEPGSEYHGLARELYSQLWSWRPRLMSTAHACKPRCNASIPLSLVQLLPMLSSVLDVP